MVKQTYVVSIYMNEEFMKQYYEPFLKLAIDDESLDIPVVKVRRKRGAMKEFQEIESPAIRAVIKKYVDFHKKKILKKEEKKDGVQE